MSGGVLVRVRVLEAWDDIVMTLPPATSVLDVKCRALAAAHVTADPAAYLVKFRGAELRDERRTLADEHVPDDAPLIVMRRRRIAAR